MPFLFLGLLFFAMTFGPRFFKLMNFGYGFKNLGLYCQYLNNIAAGFFNPFIPTFKNTFLSQRPQPLLALLWPLSLVTTSPAIFLFLDEISVIIAGFICANFTWRKTQNSGLTVAIFLSVLISPLLMTALHDGARVDLWAQPFFALLFTEYFSRRRPVAMAVYFAALCLLNLEFSILGFLIVPLILVTQTQRWNLERRARCAVGVLAVALVAAASLRGVGGQFHFSAQGLWPLYGSQIIMWLFCFWFSPLLIPEVFLFSVLLLALRINGEALSISLLVLLGALSPVVFLERVKLKWRMIHSVVSTGLIASALFYNLIQWDPFFTFWQPQMWAITENNKKVHDMLAHISSVDKVTASENFTPFLAAHLSMTTLDTVDLKTDKPDFILTNQKIPLSSSYRELEQNQQTGTRLLARIK